MIIFFRKLRAFLTRKHPCSYESKHGHDLELPSFASGKRWAAFKCKKCGKKLTYIADLGVFT